MSGFLSGFISIVGLPNVGKSTLLNCLVGEKVAIVSSKAQTTRNRITGVLTLSDCQMVFLDTPGVAEPKNKLGEYMRNTAYSSLNEVEAIIYVLDPTLGMRERDTTLSDRLKSAKSPVVGVINKQDIAKPAELEAARAFLDEVCGSVFTICATSGEGVSSLREHLKQYLAEGPQYFPGDMYTDQPERLIIGELIREKTLNLLRKEIPHGIGVDIDKISKREDSGLVDVYATIYCERKTHKGIIIGKGGSMLKRIGFEARQDIERLLGSHVNLQLYVKHREDWRNSSLALRELGYDT